MGLLDSKSNRYYILFPRQLYFGHTKHIKAKIKQLLSTTIDYLASKKDGKNKTLGKMIILLYSGFAVTLINQALIGTLKAAKEKKTNWTAKDSKFNTHRNCEVTFTLPAFQKQRQITWN
jgi:hypothetical protein